MTNKKIGNLFEDELSEILFQHGFWVHKLAQSACGQPADIIAVRDKTPFLIDCKNCTRKKFAMSRIEDNQHFSMEFWKSCNNGEGWFAFKLKGDAIVFMSHGDIVHLSYEKSELNEHDLLQHGIPIERWLMRC